MFVCEKDYHCCNYEYWDSVSDIDEQCDHLIEVEPVKYGHWIFINVTDDSSVRKDECSNCGYILTSYNYNMPTRYCPNCGAKMMEKGKKND